MELATACLLTLTVIWASLDNAGDGFLQAFLFLGPNNNHTIAIHTVTHYPIILGVATQWDGTWFSFWGNVVGQMLAQPVEFLAATAFDLAPAIIIPTVATMEAQWAVAPGDPYLDPMVAKDADSELVWTRHTTFLPFSYVDLCLRLLSMHDLWAAVRQPLVDAGQGQEMSVFINWMIHVASVCSAVQVWLESQYLKFEYKATLWHSCINNQ